MSPYTISQQSTLLISIYIPHYRDVLFTKNGQPFLIAGSGTLGWDQVASNLVEPGEDVSKSLKRAMNHLHLYQSASICILGFGSCFGLFRRLFYRVVSYVLDFCIRVFANFLTIDIGLQLRSVRCPSYSDYRTIRSCRQRS